MQIHQSAEDYLETILMLNQRMGRVRSIDVVNELGYTKASVSIAMKKLRENGYIHMGSDGLITSNDSGMEMTKAQGHETTRNVNARYSHVVSDST